MRRHSRAEPRCRGYSMRPATAMPLFGLDCGTANASCVERAQHGDFRIGWEVAELVDTDGVSIRVEPVVESRRRARHDEKREQKRDRGIDKPCDEGRHTGRKM